MAQDKSSPSEERSFGQDGKRAGGRVSPDGKSYGSADIGMGRSIVDEQKLMEEGEHPRPRDGAKPHPPSSGSPSTPRP